MKRTFVTRLPDRAGSLLPITECLDRYGLTITRISYNRAVDTRMLFLEAEGNEESLDAAEKKLTEEGCLSNDESPESVVLMAFALPERSGMLLPVLRLVHRFGFNISYISLRREKDEPPLLQMGLFADKSRAFSEFLRRASLYCPVQILDYDNSNKILDDTVFYLSFARSIAEKARLSPKESRRLLINANRIMQVLDEQNRSPYKTFDTIGQFADFLVSHEGDAYRPRITQIDCTRLPAPGDSIRDQVMVTAIEPPCGSNSFVLVREGKLIVVDCGFSRYRQEWEKTLKSLFPAASSAKSILLLTHADVDHCGCLDFFDLVYMSQTSFENFRREAKGKPALREEDPLQRPYFRICKILSSYRMPSLNNCNILKAVEAVPSDGFPYRRLRSLAVDDLLFEVYEGQGGHLPGETVFIERSHKMVFTGDIFVNIKAFSKEQAEFNRIAPYLLTSVDCNPALAKEERKALPSLLGPGKWFVFGGHGGMYRWDILDKET